MMVETVGTFFRGINWEDIAIAPPPAPTMLVEHVVQALKNMDRNQSVAHFFSQICWEDDGSAVAVAVASPALVPQKSGMSLDDLGDFFSDL
jgi:hypothetical protein